MATLVTLPPYLLDTIRDLLASEFDLPTNIKIGLDDALRDVAAKEINHPEQAPNDLLSSPAPDAGVENMDGLMEEDEEVNETVPPVIDIEVLEKLSRWALSDAGGQYLRAKNSDPSRFLLISLLAGTQIYVPAKQRALLLSAGNPDKPSPYLPSYLSPSLPSFAQEYRPIAKQLSTILDILFSIFGSAAAVYVASVTGAGYSRESAVILAILAGAIVGVADGVIVWIYVDRLEEGRRGAARRRATLGKGSGRDSTAETDEKEVAGATDEREVAGEAKFGSIEEIVIPKKREVRLRRRALGNGESQQIDS